MHRFEYNQDVDIPAAMRDMQELVFDSFACEPAQRYLVLAWALSAFLLPLSDVRALIKMEGGSNSGKTTATKFMSMLLYGENMVGHSTTAGDYAMGSKEPFIIKDNLETDDIRKDSLNFLLMAATGTTNIKRSHGTDSEVTREKLNCLVAVTAIEPFAKPELINRTYIVQFNKHWKSIGFLEDSLVRKVELRRDDMLSAWLQIIARDIIPKLADRQHIIRTLDTQFAGFSKDRANAFMSLLVLIARELIKYIPLPAEIADSGDAAPEYLLLSKWVAYQNKYAKEAEQGTSDELLLLSGLLRCIRADFDQNASGFANDVWSNTLQCRVHKTHETDVQRNRTGDVTYSFEASSQDLLAMFQRYAREHGIRSPFKNARQLGVRMSNQKTAIEEAGWTIELARRARTMRINRYSWTG